VGLHESGREKAWQQREWNGAESMERVPFNRLSCTDIAVHRLNV